MSLRYFVADNLCILANVDTGRVEIISNRRHNNSLGEPASLSPLVANLLDSFETVLTTVQEHLVTFFLSYLVPF